MNEKLRSPYTDFLFNAIMHLETLEDCYRFFEDLCTYPEIKAMSSRIVVAKMLRDKRVYSDIVSSTKASTATISRVNRSLNYGEGGYDMVFERMSEEEMYLPDVAEDEAE